MLSWLRNRKKSPEPLTFKSRVAAFWEWYATNARRFYDVIEAGRCKDLTDEICKGVDETLPHFAWDFGVGDSGVGHSFTLSGEGDPHKQLLAAFWKDRAPAIPGWTFYWTKQPTASADFGEMHLDSMVFKPIEFWLTPYVNAEAEKIELTMWHPLFPKMDERTRWTASFLFLDETLGEVDTGNWIGKIALDDKHLANAIPLAELRSFVAKTREETEWKKGAPGDIWTSYSGKEPKRGRMRRDVIAGTSCQFALIAELEDGMLDPDPLEAWGADYVFIALDARVLPTGKEVNARIEIEDALNSALGSAACGRLLGGATGLEHAYVDMLLFDGSNSIDIVQRVLREKRLPAGTSIEYFAKAKKSQRVRL